MISCEQKENCGGEPVYYVIIAVVPAGYYRFCHYFSWSIPGIRVSVDAQNMYLMLEVSVWRISVNEDGSWHMGVGISIEDGVTGE